MKTDSEWAQLAYALYSDSNGEEMPKWEDLPDSLKNAWWMMIGEILDGWAEEQGI